MRKFLPLLLLALALAAAQPSPAGETPSGGNPPRSAAQPLAVLHIENPGGVEAVLTGRQAAALGLGDFDFSGRLPGLGVRTRSVRELLKALDAAGARSFWYRLTQTGASVISQSGTMGWTLPGGDDPAPLLRALSPDAGRLAMATAALPGGAVAVTVAANAADAAAHSGGGADAWPDGPPSLLDGNPDAIGLWIMPRPLIGLAALATGADPRSALARVRMTPPSVATVTITPGDTVGVDIALEGLFPAAPATAPGLRALFPESGEPLFEANLTDPRPLLAALGVRDNPLAPAGLDLFELLPRFAHFRAWRDPNTGAIRWAAVCVMPTGFREQLPRLRAAFDLLRAAPPLHGVFPDPHTAAPGASPAQPVVFLGVKAVACVTDVVVDGKEECAVALADDAATLGNARRCAFAPGGEEALATWTLRSLRTWPWLDAGRGIAALLGIRNIDAVRDALPDGESGAIFLRGDGVAVSSPAGAALWLAPSVAAGARDIAMTLRGSPTLRTAARLRFLLDVAQQSRFRSAGSAASAPSELPRSLRDLVPADADAGRWLDNAFPRFPDHRRSNAETVRELASGTPLDGFRYEITGDGEWFIVAEGETRAFRIDGEGVLHIRTMGGRWLRTSEWALPLL